MTKYEQKIFKKKMALSLKDICLAHFEEMSNIQEIFLQYLDKEENDDNFLTISGYHFFDNLNSEEKRYKLKEIIHLIFYISNNHHRTPSFISKIEKILLFFKEDIKQTFTNDEIFKCFYQNMRIILFLFEEKIIEMTPTIFDSIFYSDMADFFVYEITAFIKGNEIEIPEENQKDYETFIAKRKIGENDDAICDMIRRDSIDDFVSYSNKTNLSLSMQIKHSIFETNSFLISKEPTLIEYAAFFGSMQIINYLVLNGVELKPSLWLYAIHSNNPDLIHFLEGHNVKINDFCLNESILCHHNDIANYFINNHNIKTNYNNYNNIILQYFNYSLFHDNFDHYKINFVNYDYITIVKAFLTNPSLNEDDYDEISKN